MKSIADMLFYTLLRQHVYISLRSRRGEDLSLPSQRAQPSVNFYPPAAKDGSAQTKAKPRGQRKRPEQETAGTREERPLKRQEKRHSHHIQRNHSAIPAGIHPCGFHKGQRGGAKVPPAGRPPAEILILCRDGCCESIRS